MKKVSIKILKMICWEEIHFYSNNSQSAKFSHVQWCVKNNFRKDDEAIERTNYKVVLIAKNVKWSVSTVVIETKWWPQHHQQ